jgi:hypothetical protein
LADVAEAARVELYPFALGLGLYAVSLDEAAGVTGGLMSAS